MYSISLDIIGQKSRIGTFLTGWHYTKFSVLKYVITENQIVTYYILA